MLDKGATTASKEIGGWLEESLRVGVFSSVSTRTISDFTIICQILDIFLWYTEDMIHSLGRDGCSKVVDQVNRTISTTFRHHLVEGNVDDFLD